MCDSFGVNANFANWFPIFSTLAASLNYTFTQHQHYIYIYIYVYSSGGQDIKLAGYPVISNSNAMIFGLDIPKHHIFTKQQYIFTLHTHQHYILIRQKKSLHFHSTPTLYIQHRQHRYDIYTQHKHDQFTQR